LTLTPTLSWWGVSGLIVAATASTWSMVSGLLAWPVIGAAMVVFFLFDRAPWGIKSSAQVAAFSAAGLGSIVLYLHNYSPAHPPGAAPDSLWTVARWAGFAFSYPLLDPTKPAEANWLPLVMAAEAIPIVAAMAVYIRRRDRPPAVLMTGIVLMVTANVVVMATARSGLVWVASRYGTVCLWGSVAALVAIADLIRMKGTRGFGRPSTWALALLAVSIVAGHAWRYRTFTTAMAEKKIIMVALFDNVSAYLRDPSPTRALRDFEPLPKDRLKVLLDDRRFVRVLPTGLRPGKESPGVALRITMILVEHARGILLSLLALYGCLMAIGLKRPHPPGKQTA
jgi:hypothetical protein